MGSTIEIKARKQINASDIRKYVERGDVKILMTTGRISRPAKELLQQHGIIFYERVNLNIEKEKEVEKE